MRNLFLSLVLILFASNIFAQDFSKMTGAQICSYKKSSMNALLDKSINTPRHSFDVQNYKLNLDIYNCFSNIKTFTASNEIYFRVDSTLSSIVLNSVNTSLAIDSVRLLPANSTLTYSYSNNLLTITLDRTYNPGEYVTIKIYYRHNSVSDGYFNTNSSGYVWTDCEPEGARCWFPCWDKPSDKATVDITARVPTNVKLGSNGRLADSTVSNGALYYHWISRDPVSTYLVVLTGKTDYALDLMYWHKPSNPIDSVPYRFYYGSGTNITQTKNAIIDMTNYFSQTFGEMPFEKNGFASVPGFNGGMENQTLTTIYPSGWTQITDMIAHEYSHQWFGDMITCGTWADIWLNEGFATYCEALYTEHISGYSAYKSRLITYNAAEYLSQNPGWAMWNASWAVTTPPVNTLFNTAITYDKGACVLHMLRYTIGDSLFFAALKSYATDTVNFKMKNAITDDFTAKFSSVSGQDLTWFIDEWVKQPNHPTYANTYNISNLGSGVYRVNFVAKQTQSNTVFHKMPITLKIAFSTGDTTVRVMNDVNNQQFTFYFYNKQPTTVTFDPDNDILLKTASITVGTGTESSELPVNFTLYQNEPNPFNPSSKIKYDIPGLSQVKLTVFDITGKIVASLVNQQQSAGHYEVLFDGAGLSSGIYFYRLETPTFTDTKKMTLIK
jgi:aminopeptidase N